MTIVTLRDVLRSIARSIQISTSFPAALFVLVNAYFVFPRFITFDLTGLEATTLIISASLILSYLLQAMNYPLIRLLEGYKLHDKRPLVQMRLRQREFYRQKLRRLDEIQREVEQISEHLPADFDPSAPQTRSDVDAKAYDKWKSAVHEYSDIKALLEANFPSNENAVLATPLGNVIAAFEEYSYTRYGMDSIALWPRLLPVLRKSNYMDFVVQEKSTFDFLLYMMTVICVLGPELAYIEAFTGNYPQFVLIMGLSVVAIWVLYQAILVSARQWGITVRVAFDLHRNNLFSALFLKPVQDIDEERRSWRELSSFIVHRQHSYPAPFLEHATAQTRPSDS